MQNKLTFICAQTVKRVENICFLLERASSGHFDQNEKKSVFLVLSFFSPRDVFCFLSHKIQARKHGEIKSDRPTFWGGEWKLPREYRDDWNTQNEQGDTQCIVKRNEESSTEYKFNSSTLSAKENVKSARDRGKVRVRPNKPSDLHSLSLPPGTFSPLATTSIPPVFSPAPNLPFPYPPLVFFRTPFSFPWIEKRWQIPRGVRCLLYLLSPNPHLSGGQTCFLCQTGHFD